MAVITASPKNFAAMLDMQATANEHLFTMRKLLETAQLTQIASLVEQKRIDEDGDRLEKIEKDTLETDKKALEIQKEQLKLMQEDAAERKKRQEDIEKIMENMAVLKSPLEKMKESFAGFRAKFSPDNLKKAFLESTNVLGINNKRIEKDRFMKEQRALGFQGDDKELARKFERAQAARKEGAGVDKRIEEIRAQAGGKYSAEEIAKNNKEMAELLKKKSFIAEEYADQDLGAKIRTEPEKQPLITPIPSLSPEPAIKQTPSEAFASAGESQEMAQEQAKLVGEQTTLLQKIEENTRGGGTEQKASQASGEGGGGILGGIGAGLKGLGMGLKGLGVGAGKGIQALLFGLAKGVMALANPMALLGLGALTIAAMGLGKALEFAAPAIEAFAPVLMKVVDVIGNIFIKAIEMIPDIIKSVGEVIMGIIGGITNAITAVGGVITGVIGAISNAVTGTIDAMTASIERLANIGGDKLMSVGLGLGAVAAGMTAFGAASAFSGITNLVSGFLGAITPGGSAIDQIMKLGNNGPNIEKAGTGVEKLASGLKAFSAVDTEKIKAIAALPTDKIAAMGAAMSKAETVEGKSAQNRALDAQAQGGGRNTNVVAPTVNNTTNKTELIRPPIRNQDSSVNRWLATKYK